MKNLPFLFCFVLLVGVFLSSCNRQSFGMDYADHGLDCPTSDFKFKNLSDAEAYVLTGDSFQIVQPGEKIKMEIPAGADYLICINQLCENVRIVPCQKYDFTPSSRITLNKEKFYKALYKSGKLDNISPIGSQWEKIKPNEVQSHYRVTELYNNYNPYIVTADLRNFNPDPLLFLTE